MPAIVVFVICYACVLFLMPHNILQNPGVVFVWHVRFSWLINLTFSIRSNNMIFCSYSLWNSSTNSESENSAVHRNFWKPLTNCIQNIHTQRPTDLAHKHTSNARPVEKIRKIVLSLLLDTRKQFNLLSHIKGLGGGEAFELYLSHKQGCAALRIYYIYIRKRGQI